jgi:hypothetical protein
MPVQRAEGVATSVATVITVPAKGRVAWVAREDGRDGDALPKPLENSPGGGWEVIGCAVDGVVAQRLGYQIDGPAWTVAQLLARARAGRLVAGDRTVLLVDEAHKVTLGDWLELARLSQRCGLRVLAVARAEQPEAIELASRFGPVLTIRKELA